MMNQPEQNPNAQIPWHRLLGIVFHAVLKEYPVEIIEELDLSKKKQILDLLVFKKTPDPLPSRVSRKPNFKTPLSRMKLGPENGRT